MKNIVSTILLIGCLAATSSATEYVYTISGKFTQQNLASPDPTITVGTPFTVTYAFQLPGTSWVQDSALGWYLFDETQQAGAATLGSLTYNFTGGMILIGHNLPHYNWFQIQSSGGGLFFKTDLATTDFSLLTDTLTIPTALNLDDFDHTRYFQVIREGQIGIAGEIESLTLTIVPEPAVSLATGCGMGLMFMYRRLGKGRSKLSRDAE